jgi:hypothetical protein
MWPRDLGDGSVPHIGFHTGLESGAGGGVLARPGARIDVVCGEYNGALMARGAAPMASAW